MTNKIILNQNIPALSENSILRYFTFIVLYFSQGIPEGITIFAIPAWMAMNGKSTLEIAGYSAVVIIPFTLKILLAPMMERYTYLPMGRRRPWLLFGQFGILCTLIALSFVQNPLDNIFLITVVVLCVHIFIIFQDIATDSLVIDIVPIEQQGKANSFMWGSKTIGTSISLFVGSWLINQYSFSNAVLIMSIPVLLIMFVPLLLKERKGEKLLPWTKGQTSPVSAFLSIDSWGKLFNSFKQVVLLRNTLLLLIAVFIIMAALHYVRTLLPIFTIKELGWNNVLYSKIYSTYNLLGGIIGMIIGGFVIQRFGIIRLIQGSFLLMAILAVTMALALPILLFPFHFLEPILQKTGEVSLIAEALPIFHVLIGILVVFSIGGVYFNALASTGAAFFGLVLQLACAILYLIFINIVVGHVKGGLTWAWSAEIVYWSLILGVTVWYLRSGKWQSLKM